MLALVIGFVTFAVGAVILRYRPPFESGDDMDEMNPAAYSWTTGEIRRDAWNVRYRNPARAFVVVGPLLVLGAVIAGMVRFFGE